jgi:hypothetical protein
MYSVNMNADVYADLEYSVIIASNTADLRVVKAFIDCSTNYVINIICTRVDGFLA